MTSRKRLVRTLGVALLAVVLSAQVAQAKPWEPIGGGRTAGAATTSARPWSPALVHAHTNQLLSESGTPPSVAASSGASTWAEVVGGAGIIVLVGALGAGVYRLRPQRPAAA